VTGGGLMPGAGGSTAAWCQNGPLRRLGAALLAAAKGLLTMRFPGWAGALLAAGAAVAAVVTGSAFSPDGRVLATADFSGRTYRWDAATRALAAVLTDPDSQGAEALAFSPDGKTLATSDQNGRTYLWDVPGCG
jgi:WD40 repeat protein